MDFKKLAAMPIIDAHIHLGAVHQIPEVLEMMDGARVSQFNLAVTIHPQRINLNPPASWGRPIRPSPSPWPTRWTG